MDRQKTGRGYEVGEDQFVAIDDEELAEARHEARSRPFSVAPAREPTPEPEVQARRPGLKLADPKSREEAPPSVAPKPIPRPIIETRAPSSSIVSSHVAQIDPRYYNTPYYVAPRDLVGLEAFSVIRDAMDRQGLVGMGRIVLANRERPLFIEPMGLGLRGVTLRYAHEVRSEEEYFADIPAIELPDDILQVTEHILNMKREDFDTTYLEDRYRTPDRCTKTFGRVGHSHLIRQCNQQGALLQQRTLDAFLSVLRRR